MRRELERIEVPDDGARERARGVVLAAFAEREPVPRSPRRARVGLVALAALAILGAALATPPGRAVLDEVREVVGVEGAQPALFSLPAPGRLLVASDAGVWVVDANGKQRLLRGYREASWSPFGRYVVATKRNELAALELDGDVRWTLARPGVRGARWTGTATDTRIAYVDRTGIRVVAGDGTGDRLLVPAGKSPLAWRPGARHALAYVAASEVRVQDVETGRVIWRANRGSNETPRRLQWSMDGRRLLVVAPHAVRVFGAAGKVVAQDDPADATLDTDAAFRPGSERVAVVRRHGAESTVFDLATGRTLFRGTGMFDEIAFSPDGRWLGVGWGTADQWVFVGLGSPRRIRAVSSVSEQFRGRPRIEGWCCAG